jgi:DNA polymerase (family 10)
MRNKEVAKKFYELAKLSEIAGENPFKIRAYLEAARRIENLTVPIEDLAKENKLTEIKGIGKSIAEKIDQYLKTGKIEKLEMLKEKIPESLLELEKVPGLGAKRAKILYDTLGIKSVEELRKAAEEGRISKLPGFGEKTEKKILEGLTSMRDKTVDRVLLGIALPLAQGIVKKLRENSPVSKIQICGSIRRMRETIGDIDILVTSNKPDKVMDAFVKLPEVKEIIVKGDTKTSILTHENLQVDLRVVEPSSFGAAIQYFTGSRQHNIHLRELAIKKGLKINEYGVFDLSTNKKIAGETEEEVYGALGLQWIPPEMREDRGEIELAEKHGIPKLIELTDIKGDLHMHSTYSDGANSIEEMAREVMRLGYEYMVISDHAKSLGIANGLSIERYMAEKKEIEKLNKKYAPFKIFLGTELNILSDGKLDFSDEELQIFDICLAGIHTAFNQDKEKMTRRIISAVKNPFVRIIVHPTGRILNGRTQFELDLDAVFSAAKENKTVFEINASPERLDLSDLNAKKAKEQYGLKLSIDTDAHSVDSLHNMIYGVGVARRAWLTKEDVINTKSLEEFEAFLKEKK